MIRTINFWFFKRARVLASTQIHRTAEMGILESPLTSQPKEGTIGLSRGEWPVG